MKDKTFRRKELVMKATLEEFTTNDFERASLNTIIKSAGISKVGINSADMIASMIKDSIDRHELNPAFDEAFIMKVLSHLLLEFDQIFEDESYSETDKVLENLKNHMTFIKYGLKA